MKKRLLILGSLREFVQLIKTAKARGIYTIVVDGYKGSIGKQYADKSYDIMPGCIEEIAALCRKENVDHIITSFSDYLFECMVKIAAAANLKCYFVPEKLDLYRNKQQMKEMLQNLGCCTPRFTSLKSDFKDEQLDGFAFPVVTKPLDKYGSRGVFVLNSAEEIRTYFDEICKTSEIKEVLAEEYHTGYEFNMMAWVLHGEVHVLSIADREKTPVQDKLIPIDSRNVYPSRLMESVYEEAKEALQKVVSFTGQTEGIISMQFFWKPGEPISVCEVAGRLLGYEHELIEYCSGLAVETLLLDYLYDTAALERNLRNHSPFFKKCSAVLYFHGKNNRKVHCQTAGEKLSHLQGVKEYWPFYQKDEIIVPHGQNPYVARYYITADSREEIDTLTTRIFKEMSVLDDEGNEVLYPNKKTVYPDELS